MRKAVVIIVAVTKDKISPDPWLLQKNLLLAI